jgi:hypothetical protein
VDIHTDSLRINVDGDALMPQHAREKEPDIWRRLGSNDLALRTWLMHFGQKDLAKVGPEVRARLREELRAWITLMGTEPRERLFGWPPPTMATAVDEKTATQCNHWLRQLLSKPRHPGQPTMATPRIDYRIDVTPHARGWALIRNMEGPDLDLFQLHVYRALAGFSSELKLCARCGTIFLPHGRQLFCSSRCAGTERKSRWRRAHRAKPAG